MIVRDDLVPQETQDLSDRIADDRRADVADVHGLGHVGGRVIDDVGLGCIDKSDRESSVAVSLLELLREPTGRESQIDVPGTGNAYRFANIR